jgi:hypothetical protein
VTDTSSCTAEPMQRIFLPTRIHTRSAILMQFLHQSAEASTMKRQILGDWPGQLLLVSMARERNGGFGC